jgi:hypothetical protein
LTCKEIIARAKAKKGTMTTLKQLHSGHNHHHHNHDNTYLKSTSKNDAGAWITRVGLYVNLGMAISKGIGGYVFHSQGMFSTLLSLPSTS